MPVLDLTRLLRAKGPGGEIAAIKGPGFDWLAMPVAGPNAAGWLFASPLDASAGETVPLRDHTGAVVGIIYQGLDDTSTSSDPTIGSDGWDLDGTQRLTIPLTGALGGGRDSTDIMVATTNNDGAYYVYDATSFGMYVAMGSGSSTSIGGGVAEAAVDGVVIPSATRNDLFDAISDGTPHVVRGTANMTGKASITIGARYDMAGSLTGKIHGVAIYASDTAASAPSRDAARDHLRALVARLSSAVALP